MSHDSNRTRIWFPMFSYFESSVDGIIPNEYDSPSTVCYNVFQCIVYVKDCCMLTARRFWIAHNQLPPLSKTLMRPNGLANTQISFLSKNLNNLVVSSNKRFSGIGRMIFPNTETDNEQANNSRTTESNTTNNTSTSNASNGTSITAGNGIVAESAKHLKKDK